MAATNFLLLCIVISIAALNIRIAAEFKKRRKRNDDE